MKEMNKPFVALLAIVVSLGALNVVMAAPMIQRVFVTNFPENQNVTVTNPPTVTTNVTVNFPGAEPKMLVLGDNRSLTVGSTDTFTFSVRGYAWWSITFDGTGVSVTTFNIYLKNGPAVALYTAGNWGATGYYTVQAFQSDEVVFTISNPASNSATLVYDLGVALSIGQ